MSSPPSPPSLALPRVGVRFPSWITFQRGVFDGILKFMQAHEPWVIEAPMDSGGELAPVVIGPRWHGDGLIVFRYTPQEATAWRKAGIPVVNLSTERLGGVFPSIVPDNEGGGAAAAKHLLTLGLRHFAYVGRATPFVDDGLTGLGVARRYSQEREAGFRKTLEEAGFTPLLFQVSTRRNNGPVWEELHETYSGLLQALPRPCGVFAADDMLAHGLLQAAQSSGARVPQDVALVGFNDQSHFCQAATPPLSSVTYPGEAIGLRAAEAIYALMQGLPAPGGHIQRVPVSGVTIRESTNVLSIRDPLVASAVRLIRKQAAATAPRVGEIADQLGVSASLLRQRFLEALGISPKEEVDRARLDIIRHWLTTTKLGPGDIAAKTGFLDAAELRRFFRRGTGQTLQDYRAAFKA
ncbi:xylose operon transcription regulator XylR [Verrucomicrobium spinosum]|uniref:AraC family transcriptional regulator n=1 Tax=Verrucomicrobium spinosum TaxID=2736 RepID=UPI00049285E2|nr:XylR family transcriptional regulator [Verrucomicrobium spinosum]